MWSWALSAEGAASRAGPVRAHQWSPLRTPGKPQRPDTVVCVSAVLAASQMEGLGGPEVQGTELTTGWESGWYYTQRGRSRWNKSVCREGQARSGASPGPHGLRAAGMMRTSEAGGRRLRSEREPGNGFGAVVPGTHGKQTCR